VPLNRSFGNQPPHQTWHSVPHKAEAPLPLISKAGQCMLKSDLLTGAAFAQFLRNSHTLFCLIVQRNKYIPQNFCQPNQNGVI
jgi:hypothetical protein